MTENINTKRVLEILVLIMLSCYCLIINEVSGVKTCRATLDLVIIVDSSASVGSKNFKTVTTFVCDLISQLPVQPDGIRVGVVRYATNADVITYLGDAMEKDKKIKAVQSMAYKKGATYTNRALALTRKTVLTPEHGERSDVPNLIILITDGVSTEQKATFNESTILKANPGLKILTVGIGSSITDEELIYIASRPDMVYRVSNFSGLAKIVQDLTEFSCSDLEEIKTTELTTEFFTSSPVKYIYRSIKSSWVSSVQPKILSSSSSPKTPLSTLLAMPPTTMLRTTRESRTIWHHSTTSSTNDHSAVSSTKNHSTVSSMKDQVTHEATQTPTERKYNFDFHTSVNLTYSLSTQVNSSTTFRNIPSTETVSPSESRLDVEYEKTMLTEPATPNYTITPRQNFSSTESVRTLESSVDTKYEQTESELSNYSVTSRQNFSTSGNTASSSTTKSHEMSFNEFQYVHKSTISAAYSEREQLTTTSPDVTSAELQSTDNSHSPESEVSKAISTQGAALYTNNTTHVITASSHSMTASLSDHSVSHAATSLSIGSVTSPDSQSEQSKERSPDSTVGIYTTLTASITPHFSNSTIRRHKDTTSSETSSASVSTRKSRARKQNTTHLPMKSKPTKAPARNRTMPEFITTPSASPTSSVSSNTTTPGFEPPDHSLEDVKDFNVTYRHGGDLSSKDVYIFIAGGSATAVILVAVSSFLTVLLRRRKNRTFDGEL